MSQARGVISFVERAAARLRTPAYLYDPRRLIESYQSLRQRLGTRLLVSLKANPSATLLDACAAAFDGIEVASERELSIAATCAQLPCFVNTPALAVDLARSAANHGAAIIIDNPSQLDVIVQALEQNYSGQILLRANSAAVLPRQMSRTIPSHFGMLSEDLIASAKKLNQLGFRVAGLHVFAGSNTFQDCSWRIVPEISRLVAALESEIGYKLSVLDLGGGIPANWATINFDWEDYRAALEPLSSQYHLYHEAGRAIFSGCGSFLTRVVAIKDLQSERIAVCDGGMAQNFLLAQTERLSKQLQRPQVVHIKTNYDQPSGVKIKFVGSSCDRSDVIGAIDEPSQTVTTGDIAVFENCGAYNSSYTLNGFLSLPSAHEYLMGSDELLACASGGSETEEIKVLKERISLIVVQAEGLPIHEESIEEAFALHRRFVSELSGIDHAAQLTLAEDVEIEQLMPRYQAFTARLELYLEGLMQRSFVHKEDVSAERRRLLREIRGFFGNVYRAMTTGEIGLLALQPNQTVCQVGIGEMPLSLLQYQSTAGVRVIGLDNNAPAAEAAKAFLCRTNGNSSGEVLALDGKDFDYRDCDAVIIAMSVMPKPDVVSRIAETARGRPIKVVNRNTVGLNRFFYAPRPVTDDRLTLIGTVTKSNISSSVYQLECP